MIGAGTLPPGPILASACLLGRRCRYDGGHCAHPAVLRLARHRQIVPICPEIAGGLRTPRAPAEILGGDGRDVLAGRALVLDREGRDLTGAFLAGARAAAALAREHGARAAILKEHSPSCGVRWIYDGSFSGRRVPGQGVATARLAEEGVRVLSEEECGETLPRGGCGGRDEGRGKPPAP
ncbi:MAG: DUF523 domain-containing protein [Bacteroidota bacterium]